MKRFLSGLLALVMLITCSLVSYQTVHASTVIPTAYIDSYTLGAGEADATTIVIKLDNPATETTRVWYRTQLGSAHDLATTVSLSKFIDFKDGSVVFNTGEQTKEVIIPHYNPDSYEEASRFYAVQLYKAEGNVLIDKSRDFLEIPHREFINTISTSSHDIYKDTSSHRFEDDGTKYYPSYDLTWNDHVSDEGKYWSRIGVNSYKVWLDGTTYTDSAIANFYFLVNDSGIFSHNNDHDGKEVFTLGPATVKGSDNLRVKFTVYDAEAPFIGDYGELRSFRFYGQPVDTTAPSVQQLIFYPGDTTNNIKTNYSAGQEIFIGVQFDEIVRVTTGQEADVYLPIKADDGSVGNATYWKGSGTDVLVFKYTVPAGKTATHIKVSNNGAGGKEDIFYGEEYVKDIAGNIFSQTTLGYRLAEDGSLLFDNIDPAVLFTFDGTTPVITGITADKNNTALRSSAYVDITLTFDRKVKLLGDAKLTLNNGAVATQTKSSAYSASHKFRYNVGSSSAEDISALKVTGLTGATVVSENEATGFVFPGGDNIKANKIIIDNTKPVIVVDYITSPTVYRQSHTINVTAEDAVSGINTDKSYQYGLVEGNYGTTGLLGKDLTISQAATSKVYIKVSDAAGNVEYAVTNDLKFDKAPPSINFLYPDSGQPKSKANVGLVITDPLSGLAGSAQYTWYDESNSVVESGSVTGLSGTSANNKLLSYAASVDGKYKLNLSVEDSAGNLKEATSELIYVDKTAPVISVSPSDKRADKSSYDIVISATDPNGANTDGSIKYIEYQWESGSTTSDWMRVNSDIATFSYNNKNASGESLLRVVAADNTGSTENELNTKEETYTFTFDNDGPNIVTNSGDFNTNVRGISIDISITDDLNEVGDVYYAFRGNDNVNYSGTDWMPLGSSSGAVTKDNDNGTFYLHVKASDTEGNEAYHVSEPFMMDNEPALGTIDIMQSITKQDTVSVEMTLITQDKPGIVQYKLSEDGSNYSDYQDFVPSVDYTFSDNSEGVKRIYLILKDYLGNESEAVYDTVVLDKTAPTAEIEYSTLAVTNDDVVATIRNLSDDVSSASNISANPTNYTFTDNGTYTFVITDEAGNQGYVPAEVTWIDRVPPNIQFLPESDTSYTKEKTVQLQASKEGHEVTREYRIVDVNNNELKSLTGFENGEIITLNYDNPVYIEVSSADELGNTITRRGGVYNVDNLPPLPTVSYSITSRTANDVTATVTFNETASVTNNGGSNRYTFTENGEFVFEFSDIAGNTGQVLAAVDYIDRSIPSARLSLSETDYTAGPIDVTASVEVLPTAEIGVAALDGVELAPKSTKTRDINGKTTVYEAVYEINKSGTFGVNIIDAETLVSEISSVLITNIDTEPPIFSYELSNYGRTRDNIDVRISYSDVMSEPVTIVSEPVVPVDGVYTFSENGEYIFTLRDAVGNQDDYSVVIENIDREIHPEIRYSTVDFINTDVTATVFSSDEEIFVRNNYENTAYTFIENGEFTFEVYDVAGNTAEITAEVDWINKVGFDFRVVPSTKEKTNQPITLVIEPADKVGSIASKEALLPNEGTNSQFTVTQIGKYTFAVTDLYHNVKEISYYVGNVDCTPPQLSYTLGLNTARGRITVQEGEEITSVSSSIRIAFSAEEKYEFIEYDKSLEHDMGAYAFTAYENGTYTFRARDLAGNESSKAITLTNIADDIPPVVTVSYTDTSLTNQNVIASISSNEEIFVTNNYRSPHRLFTENGSFTFQVSDAAGNRTEVTAVVNNIDKTPPLIDISYSTREKTKEDVIVSLTSKETFFVKKEALTRVDPGMSYDYTFENNHTAFFVIQDEAGNEITVFARAENIDKEAPTILFMDSKPILINVGNTGYDFLKDVYSDSIDADKYVVDTSGVNFYRGGLYEVIYKAYDDVGNVGTRSRVVDIADPNEPLLTRINGMNPAYDYYFVSDRIELDVRNIHGSAAIYYDSKKTSITDLKQKGEKLEGRAIAVEKSGWYSFLIVDKDLNKRFYQVFISK